MRITIASIVTIFLFIFSSTTISAQTNQTAEFKVSGVCDMCRVRIENAALIKGVKFAKWDKQTQMVKIIYNSKKTNQELVQKAIAKVGHDAADVKAKKEVYETLPGCCKYREGNAKVH